MVLRLGDGDDDNDANSNINCDNGDEGDENGASFVVILLFWGHEPDKGLRNGGGPTYAMDAIPVNEHKTFVAVLFFALRI
jgi:hypothetical protein